MKCRNSPRNRKLLQVTLPRGSDSYLIHTEYLKERLLGSPRSRWLDIKMDRIEITG